jgi:hypothetical protein
MPATREDWERVGPLLVERRAQISARYANRSAFAQDTGLGWRTLHDAENGKRATFKAGTVSALEAAYRLVPGSLERALAGGPLEPLAPAPPQAAVPGSPPPSAPGGDEYAEVIFMLLEEYPTRQWWDLYGASWRLQEHGSLPLLREALLTRRRAAEAPEDNGARTEQARDNPAS